MEAGTIGVLNVGAGDTKLTFDPNKPEERAHAAKVVTDMLRRGYALLVRVGELEGEPIYQRAYAFDADKFEYMIREVPIDDPETLDKTHPAYVNRRRKSTRRIKAEKTHAIAVARSAGG